MCQLRIEVAGVPAMVGARVLALASGEESRASDASAQSAACRGRTAASMKADIVTTPCRNPNWLHQGGKHAAAARVRVEPRRSRDGAMPLDGGFGPGSPLSESRPEALLPSHPSETRLRESQHSGKRYALGLAES